MSEGFAYLFGPLLVNLSKRWDYLNEFEWSVRRVWVENMAESLSHNKTKQICNKRSTIGTHCHTYKLSI